MRPVRMSTPIGDAARPPHREAEEAHPSATLLHWPNTYRSHFHSTTPTTTHGDIDEEDPIGGVLDLNQLTDVQLYGRGSKVAGSRSRRSRLGDVRFLLPAPVRPG